MNTQPPFNKAFPWHGESLDLLKSIAKEIHGFLPDPINPRGLTEHDGFKSLRHKTCLATTLTVLVNNIYEAFDAISIRIANYCFIRHELKAIQSMASAVIEIHKTIKGSKDNLLNPVEDEFIAACLFSALHAHLVATKLLEHFTC
jgi:hypothetical protein